MLALLNNSGELDGAVMNPKQPSSEEIASSMPPGAKIMDEKDNPHTPAPSVMYDPQILHSTPVADYEGNSCSQTFNSSQEMIGINSVESGQVTPVTRYGIKGGVVSAQQEEGTKRSGNKRKAMSTSKLETNWQSNTDLVRMSGSPFHQQFLNKSHQQLSYNSYHQHQHHQQFYWQQQHSRLQQNAQLCKQQALNVSQITNNLMNSPEIASSSHRERAVQGQGANCKNEGANCGVDGDKTANKCNRQNSNNIKDPASIKTDVEEFLRSLPISTDKGKNSNHPTTQVSTMPTSTVTTAIISTTVLNISENSMLATTSTSTCVTTTTDSTPNGPSGTGGRLKRKSPGVDQDGNASKRQNTGKVSHCIEGEDDNSIMKLMFAEIMGMKSAMNSQFEHVNQKMEVIHEDNLQWKQKLGILEQDMVNVKKSLETLNTRLDGEKGERTAGVSALEVRMNQAAQDQQLLGQRVDQHETQMQIANDSLQILQSKVDELDSKQQSAQTPMMEMKNRLEDMLGQISFPVKRTVIAQNVWYSENEDLEKIASAIINKALGLAEIKVVNVERKSGRDTGSGLLKIELENSESVKLVLKNKSKLKEASSKELREIFLRPSKRDEILMMERNQDAILRELGKRKEFVRLPSGHLVKKRDYPRGESHRGGYRSGGGGSGRGRGRPFSGRPAGVNPSPTGQSAAKPNDVPIAEYMA